MPNRRILSLWFPHLAAERMLRQGLRRDALPGPFAVAGDRRGAQILVSLNALAREAGLREGQPVAEAGAMCPGLVTQAEQPLRDAAFLTVLRRWAGKFSPWVAEERPDALMVDLTGCAHLFGGEAGLLRQVAEDCADLGLTVRAGVADTAGAAWALARFAGQAAAPVRNGDAVDQEARATRSRAAKRRGWERGGPAPVLPAGAGAADLPGVIAAPGRLREVLAPLPLAALRLEAEAVEGLARLGLRRVADIAGLPRAGLARRFGAGVLKRLDQAYGLLPEPISPARAPLHFAVRLTLPEPVGLRSDIEAGMDRLLAPLCDKLRAQGRGARRVRLEAFRADGGLSAVEVGLARPGQEPGAIRPLLALKLDQIEAGFGIDCLRVEAVETEPVHARQHRGQIVVGQAVAARAAADTALEDLIGRMGARLGSDQVIRLHPAESHIPEKSHVALAAAWSQPWEGAGEGEAARWPAPRGPRPLVLIPPEPVTLPEGEEPGPTPPACFRWRRQEIRTRVAAGPERIMPEWWFDDPAWRSGPRDYWRVEAQGGGRLWLYYAHGGEVSGGWFCHGRFA